MIDDLQKRTAERMAKVESNFAEEVMAQVRAS